MGRPVFACLLTLTLLALACGLLPLRQDLARVTATDDALASVVTTVPLPATLSAVSISRIPLHVGTGVRGPWFDVYFTDPVNPAAGQMTGGLDGPIAEAIDAARLSIHAAVFSLTLDDVRDALVRAHRRGIDVGLVTDSDNLDSEDMRRLLDAGVPVLGDRRESTMHNKFMVIDGAEVWTGSMNFTASGTYLDNNTVLRLRSTELAEDYETEFAEMFEDDTFGDRTGRPTPKPHIELQGTLVDVYFSPDDGVEGELVDLIDVADRSIDFLAYSFTSDRLGDAVRRAHRKGLTVRGVVDEDQAASNTGGELEGFLAEGIDVRLDGNARQMHEKIIILDGEVVVVGSYNFSRNASEINDENVLVIHGGPIASQFLLEFERLYALAQR